MPWEVGRRPISRSQATWTGFVMPMKNAAVSRRQYLDEPRAGALMVAYAPDGGATAENPPRFSWLPALDDAARYILRVSPDAGFPAKATVSFENVVWNFFTPDRTFEPGGLLLVLRALGQGHEVDCVGMEHDARLRNHRRFAEHTPARIRGPLRGGRHTTSAPVARTTMKSMLSMRS